MKPTSRMGLGITLSIIGIMAVAPVLAIGAANGVGDRGWLFGIGGLSLVAFGTFMFGRGVEGL